LKIILKKYFTGFKNPAMERQIKIYYLLTHPRGLPDDRKAGEDSIFYLTAKDAENRAPVMKNDILEFTPGENCSSPKPIHEISFLYQLISKNKRYRVSQSNYNCCCIGVGKKAGCNLFRKNGYKKQQ
jgi:hypothetical protein